MLISTKGRYALRVMLSLAEKEEGKLVPLQTVAREQEISEKYLESIIVILARAGLVYSLRGKKGGYCLSRKPEEYSVGEILKLTEGSLAPVACLDSTPNTCSKASECKTLPMWENLNTIINNYLYSVTLKDLLNPETSADYQI
ncbi:MAG: Rrf2 family transcriptional regulator [Ruminococcaceae bacterium]|nr:Rrf2 family transcriptional regulator [Oscillospiraceae bacterium]